jgi:serine/threonine protein kinase
VRRKLFSSYFILYTSFLFSTSALNIMRAAGEVKLIDLDASVSFTSGKNFTALKFSSGHVAPELVYCSDTLTCVRSASFSIASRMVNSVLNLNEEEEEEEEETQENATVSALAPENSSPNVRIRLGSMDYNLAPLYPEFVANLEGESKEGSLALSRYCSEMSSGDGNIIRSKREYDLVPAARAHDLWSLGVVIYELATNAPLFLVDGDGNIHKSDLKVLSEWKDSVKNERLERVQNVAARNLISLLLSKDPKKRPNIEQVLAHPFLTGNNPNPINLTLLTLTLLALTP